MRFARAVLHECRLMGRWATLADLERPTRIDATL